MFGIKEMMKNNYIVLFVYALILSGCSNKVLYDAEISRSLPNNIALSYLKELPKPQGIDDACYFYLNNMSAEEGNNLPYSYFYASINDYSIKIKESHGSYINDNLFISTLASIPYGAGHILIHLSLDECFIPINRNKNKKALTALKAMGVEID